MNNTWKLLLAASAIAALAGCEANGRDGSTFGPPGGGGGGGGGGLDCDAPENANNPLCDGGPILVDLGDILGTVSDVGDFTCTNFPTGVGTEVTGGGVCLLGDTLGLGLCTTLNPEAAADGDPINTFASVNLVTSLLGVPGALPAPTAFGGVRVDNFGTVAADNVAAFVVSFPSDTAEVNLAKALTVTTFLDGVEQESFDGLEPLGVGLVGAQLIGSGPVLIGFENELPYNALEFIVDGVVQVDAISLDQLLGFTGDPTDLIEGVTGEVARVFNFCTSAMPPASADPTPTPTPDPTPTPTPAP